jgi:hypothetical protein
MSARSFCRLDGTLSESATLGSRWGTPGDLFGVLFYSLALKGPESRRPYLVTGSYCKAVRTPIELEALVHEANLAIMP